MRHLAALQLGWTTKTSPLRHHDMLKEAFNSIKEEILVSFEQGKIARSHSSVGEISWMMRIQQLEQRPDKENM